MDSGKKQTDGGKAACAQQPACTDAGEGAGTGAGSRDDVPAQEEASGGGEEAVDDEQVERFFALLANIRAMRRMYMPGTVAGGDDAATASGGKRSRSAAAGPWRPVFRMEDFDEDGATSRCVRMREEGSSQKQQPADQEKKGDAGAGPVVAPPPPRTDTGGSDSI